MSELYGVKHVYKKNRDGSALDAISLIQGQRGWMWRGMGRQSRRRDYPTWEDAFAAARFSFGGTLIVERRERDAHTKGPWTCRPLYGESDLDHVHHYEVTAPTMTGSFDEMEANARLIRHAPSLHESITQAYDILIDAISRPTQRPTMKELAQIISILGTARTRVKEG